MGIYYNQLINLSHGYNTLNITNKVYIYYSGLGYGILGFFIGLYPSIF